ncbi:MAG: anaerobic sulfatase maturase [Clostridia bacterium]|nr:anaerobic sulfatase maturase [Clostridia bacterium]
MRNVIALIKPASSRCNMRCDYCFYGDEAEKRRQASYGLMTEETLKNVIRRCVIPAEGSCVFAFQGGEPTLRGIAFYEKAVEYAAHFNRRGVPVQFSLQTNGYALDDAWSAFFAKNRFLIGVSVDGTREIHDRCRHTPDGGPTYERVMEGVASLKRFGVEFNILTVVHREVAENIAEIYRDYRRKGFDYLQFITCLDPLGEERGRRAYSLTPEAYGRFLITLFDLWYRDQTAGRAPSIRQFENYIGILLGEAPEACEQRGRCGAQYTVEADGSVYPCDFYALDEWRIGNFNENRLSEMDETREALGFRQASFPVPGACEACRWYALCRNGCLRSRLPLCGPEGGRNYFCRGYQMFFECCHDRLYALAKRLRR